MSPYLHYHYAQLFHVEQSICTDIVLHSKVLKIIFASPSSFDCISSRPSICHVGIYKATFYNLYDKYLSYRKLLKTENTNKGRGCEFEHPVKAETVGQAGSSQRLMRRQDRVRRSMANRELLKTLFTVNTNQPF
jgi:hypothetical protein